MKHLSTALILTVLFIGTSFPSENPTARTVIKQSTIASLLEGLSSKNIGLKSSCAYMLGDLQLSEAVIPLMKVLRNDDNEDLRIAAALALYKIGSPIAINAVKQSIRFDESERVRKHCTSFYTQYSKNKFNDEEKIEYAIKTASK